MAFLPDDPTLKRVLQRLRAPAGPGKPPRSRADDEGNAPEVALSRSVSDTPPSAQVAPPPSLFPLADLSARLESASSMEGRLSVVAEWLEQSTDANAAFIADAEGLPLTETRATDQVVAAAGAVREALAGLRSMIPDAGAGVIRMELGDGNKLELCEFRSPLGTLFVGLIGARRNLDEWQTWLGRAFSLAVG